MDLSYLLGVVTRVHRERPLEDRVEWEYRLREVVATKNKEKILAFLEELEQYSGADLQDYKVFVELIDWEELRRQEAARIPEPVYEALKARAVPAAADFVKIPLSIPWEVAKQITLKIADGTAEDTPLVVPFSENVEIKGTLISKLSNYLIEVPVAAVYKSKKGDENIVFIDEKAAIKSKPVREVTYSGYLYEMLGDDGQRYVVLMPFKVELAYGRVKGMEVKALDVKTVGEASKVRTYTNLVLGTYWENLEEAVPFEKIEELRQPSFEDLYEKIFGKFRHPEWFERLLLAWLFSGKVHGYPLHILLIAPPHTGKSTLLESIEKHFPEDRIYGEGTIKGMVPSFGAGRISVGEFVKRKRFFLVDEFLRIVYRTKAEGTTYEGLLNEVLEHKRRVAASGATEPIEINPRARMLAASNWTRHIRSIPDLAQEIDPAFLSRMLIYVMTKEHKDFVVRNKKRNEDEGWHPDMLQPWEDLRPLVDWAQSFIVEMDYKRIYETVEKYAKYVPSEAEDVYVGRYSDHLIRVLDGVVKTRYLCREKEDLVPDEEDYSLAEEIFGMVILSWSVDPVVLKNLPPKLKLYYLPTELVETYYYVRKFGVEGVSTGTLAELMGLTQQGVIYRLKRLEEEGIVKCHGAGPATKWYPYWVEWVDRKNGREVNHQDGEVS